MADRLQVQTEFTRALRQDSLAPEAMRPTAAPVDTFAPDESGPDKLAQLAHALGQVSPAVAQLGEQFAQRGQQQDQADAQAAVSEAVRNGAKTYGDAVKRGAIPASASPWYRMYAKKQFGQLMAGQMASDLQAAASKDLANATDLSQFDQYAAQFQKQWIAQHAGDAAGDVAFSEGFNPTANGTLANMREQFAAESGKRLQVQTASALIQNTTQAIRMGKQQGLSTAAIQSQLNDAANAALAAGMTGDVVNAALSEAIGTYAENNHDLGALDLASGVKAGTGYLLDTGAFGKVKERAEPYIIAQQTAADTRFHEQKVRQVQETRDTQLTSAIVALHDNPSADIRPMLSALKSVNDAAGVEALLGYQQAAQRHEWAGNPGAEAQGFAAAADPNGARITKLEVTQGIARGTYSIAAGHEMLSVLDERERQAKAEAATTSVFRDPNYKILHQTVTERMRALGLPGESQQIGHAMMDIYNGMTELQTNPDYVKNPRSAASRALAQAVADDAFARWSGQTAKQFDEQSQRQAGVPQADAAGPGASPMKLFAQRLLIEKRHGGFSVETNRRLTQMGLTTPKALREFMAAQGVIPATPTTTTSPNGSE